MSSPPSCVGKSGNWRAKVSEWERGQEQIRANKQQLLISSFAVDYEQQNCKKSNVFFKITHLSERTISKYTSQTSISEWSVNVVIRFSVNICSQWSMNTNLMVFFAGHLCLPFTVILSACSLLLLCKANVKLKCTNIYPANTSRSVKFPI